MPSVDPMGFFKVKYHCPPQTSGSIINADVVTCSTAISACVGDKKKVKGPADSKVSSYQFFQALPIRPPDPVVSR